jgi:hypothetical protein
MRLRHRFLAATGLCAALVLGLLGGRSAAAFEPFVGTRALGMGGGLRGAATGGSGPLLNPSGMSLIQSYNVEADYFFARVRDENFLHASIVDSTSGYKLAGGLYYTYHTDNPDGPTSGHGHEVGLALSLPLGEHIAVGGTLKYFHLSGDQATPASSGGLTFDVGATVRITDSMSLGIVGASLNRLGLGQAPRSLGYGLAFSPGADLLLVLDGVTNLTADAPLPRKGTRLSAGGELLLAKKVSLRAGGGYDGVFENGFFTVGVAAVSEAGTLDFGVRQDAFRNGAAPRETILAISFRLFVPQP